MNKKIIFIIISILILRENNGNASDILEKTKYEENVSVAVKTLKTIYETNEPVQVIMAIANHGSEPIYLFQSEKDFLNNSCNLKDANGIEIMGDPLLTPKMPTADHYMIIDNKRTYVVPVYKIDGKSVFIAIISDALWLYHKHISEGTFQLDFDGVQVIHKIDNLINRKDVSHPLWVEPSSPMTKLRHKCGTVKIEIRKKSEPENEAKADLGKKILAESKPFAWSAFLAGAAVAVIVIAGLLLFLRKNVSNKAE